MVEAIRSDYRTAPIEERDRVMLDFVSELTRDATRHLLDELRATSPAVVDELVPGVMKLAEVQQVLHLLLREGLPIRNLGSILESLGDYASRTSDTRTLAEHARQKLSRTICTRYRDSERRLHVLALDAAIEDRIRAACENTDAGQLIRLSPVAVANARNLKSSVPPTNVRPLAVSMTPPELGRPVSWKPAGSMSDTPSVFLYAMSPVSMLTATSSPHGVGPHSRCRSGSPKRRVPASGPELT